MSYHDTVSALAEDAEQLEQVYHAALKAGETDAFKQAIDDSHTSAPENLLYAAWFHRLKYTAAQAKGYAVAWAWVIPLAVINGLLFWWLSDDRFMITIEGFRGTGRDFMPAIVLLAASLSAVVCADLSHGRRPQALASERTHRDPASRRRRVCALDLPANGPGAIPGAVPHSDGYASAPPGLGGCGCVLDRQAS